MTTLLLALVTASPEHDAARPWKVKKTRPTVWVTAPAPVQAAPLLGREFAAASGREAGTASGRPRSAWPSRAPGLRVMTSMGTADRIRRASRTARPAAGRRP